MRVIILDTQTGISHEVGDGQSSYYWTDGNGSCDCNRRLLCSVESDKPDGVCEGHERFLISRVLSVEEGDTACTLAELNEHYPATLKKRHGIN